MDWKDRVRAAFPAGQQPDEDVVEELAGHAAALAEAARAEGADGAAAASQVEAQIAAWAADTSRLARRRARRAVVDPPPATGSSLAGLGRDLRYAVQTIRRQWRLTALITATLALGVCATTVLFSVAYGVLVKPMPWPDADRLVRLYETRQGSQKKATIFTNGTFLAWADRPATIDAIAGWSAYQALLSGNGPTERIRVAEATPELLPMLGAGRMLGTLFTKNTDGKVDQSQVILSYQFWRDRFGGSPDVIGRPLRIDGTAYHVVGVAARGFWYPDPEVQAYIPFEVPQVGNADGRGGTIAMFSALARLRPGVTVAQAAAEATARGRSAADPGLVTMAVFGSRGAVQVSVVPLLDSVVGEVRPALIVFLAAVCLLLAVATANVASLQLARATSRRREMAIRSAIGAGIGRITRQLLVENLVMGQLGGLCGLALAAVLLRALPAIAPADFPRLAEIGMDYRAALFALAVSLVASLAFGLAPVMQMRRLDVTQALSEDGLAPVGGNVRTKTARARLLIMIGQMAAAAVLLVGAALLGRSFLALLQADRGYNPNNLLTSFVTLPDESFTPQRRLQTLEAAVARLRAVPGVTAVAYASRLPLAGGAQISAAFPVPARQGGNLVTAHASLLQVSSEFFKALGARVREGRPFTDRDAAGSQEVVVVNRTFARQYLNNPAVGTQLPSSKGRREVVGVIDDANYGNAGDRAQPEVYMAISQIDGGFRLGQAAVLIRTTGSTARATAALQAFAREQGGTVVLGPVMTMEERVWTSLAKPRLYALLLGGFAAFALAVAGVGLFGVLTYSVSLRAREIGVRTTLGATPAAIALLVVRQALVVTGAGLIVGLAVAAALGRTISGLLYGVAPLDGSTFGGVAALLALVAVTACIIPARRAARVDPVRVLR
jgi:putative ABC transport system permease protein